MGIQTKVRRTKIANKSLEVIVTGKSSEDLTRQTLKYRAMQLTQPLVCKSLFGLLNSHLSKLS